MSTLSFDFTGRRSHDTTLTRSPTRAPSPLPPLDGTFTEETPRASIRIPSDEGVPATAPTPTPAPAPAPTPQKRLAMFTEKISASTSSFARGPAQLLPGSRSHSQHPRTESQLRENAGSPAPLIAPSTSGGGSSKVHSSPSKVRCVRQQFLFRPFIFSTCLPLAPVQPRLSAVRYDIFRCAYSNPLCDVAVGPITPFIMFFFSICSNPRSSLVSCSSSQVRTYDSKLVSREMHRLGSLAYLPHYAPNLNAGTSSTPLVATSSIAPPNLVPGSASDNPWGTLHVLVLPLFNGEPLRIPMYVYRRFFLVPSRIDVRVNAERT